MYKSVVKKIGLQLLYAFKIELTTILFRNTHKVAPKCPDECILIKTQYSIKTFQNYSSASECYICELFRTLRKTTISQDESDNYNSNVQPCVCYAGSAKL